MIQKMKASDNNSPDFHNLFESAPGLYLVLTPSLKIVAVTNAYLAATLTERKNIIGKGLFEVFPDNPDDPAASGVANLKASLHRVLQTKAPDAMAVQKYDIPRPESEGGGFEEKYWSPLNTPVLGANNEVEYIIHRVEDVTEFIRLKQKGAEQNKLTEELRTKADRMETEIFRRAQDLQEANKKLREAEIVKSEFFANVSHELRTPLSLIIAPLESILSGKYGEVPESRVKFLHIIHNNALRLLQLVNGLLDFAKFDAGKMKAHRESTDIEALVKTVLNDFESMMRGKKIDLSFELKISDRNVMTDRYLVERILFNLLSNAAKFTPNEGKVMVTVTTENDNLYIEVKDTGIGIPQAEIGNLFQRFRQVEGSAIRRFEGTGLGLAMVKEFAELLGGSVSVTSQENTGSTFVVNCLAPSTTIAPAAGDLRESRKLVPVYQTLRAGEDTGTIKGDNALMKVLVCEDNEELLAYIVSLLEGVCVIRTTRNGKEALGLVNTWKPDLVLSDVMMPEKDGITLCREIKSNPETSSVMVVLLTALTHREAMMKGWEAQADEYLFKPFHPEELITRIRSLLSAVRERRKAHVLLDKKNAELLQANADLEAFSYSVSHDLKAPLRSISGYSEILKEDYAHILDENGNRFLGIILQNADRMDNLIDDLLEFSRIERRGLNKSEINMEALVASVIDEMNGKVRQNVDIKVNTLHSIEADPALLTQVWVNLISNAIKYSSKKENPFIEISSTRNESDVVYVIKDNGTGFDMAYAHKLFGVFQRLHKASEFEGTGIGLALVKRIIIRHSGKVWAEGKVNEGAAFYFSLPVVPEK